MENKIILEKMSVSLDQEGMAQYTLSQVKMNALVGTKIKLNFSGAIFCLNCAKKTKKSFNQGYCYPCFIKLAACDMCVMKPETCHYDKGTCREPKWGEEHCMIPHYVYLANSSGLKVGITRETQIPVRWIDQGASEAMTLFRVKNRYHSGLVEVMLKELVTDKTQWQKMLKGETEVVDFVSLKNACQELLKKKAPAFLVEETNNQIIKIKYPVKEYPKKVNSYSVEKTPLIEDTLQGIKGQYLILSQGVINLRKYSGYEMSLEY